MYIFTRYQNSVIILFLSNCGWGVGGCGGGWGAVAYFVFSWAYTKDFFEHDMNHYTLTEKELIEKEKYSVK